MRFLFLSLLFLAACSSKPKEAPPVALPAIPSKTLKDPSSLAFDGSSFYLTDWPGGGILKLGPLGASSWIPLAGRPIQAVAIAPATLLAENDEGKLFLWQEGSKNLKPISSGIPRQPGSPVCWDGIYLWMLIDQEIRASVLAADKQLTPLPGAELSVESLLIPGAEIKSLACGWNQSAVLLQYSPLENGEIRYGMIAWAKEAEQKTALSWDLAGTPIALTYTREGLAALVRKKEGEFEILRWQNGR